MKLAQDQHEVTSVLVFYQIVELSFLSNRPPSKDEKVISYFIWVGFPKVEKVSLDIIAFLVVRPYKPFFPLSNQFCSLYT